jgi:hypothetical protein
MCWSVLTREATVRGRRTSFRRPPLFQLLDSVLGSAGLIHVLSKASRSS